MFIVGNWKMNGTLDQARALARALVEQLPAGAPTTALFPPAPHLTAVLEEVADSPIFVGGQDCSPHPDGAHTGDVSAAMLVDLGARGVIVGHSERRTNHGETDAQVLAKVTAGMQAGIGVILCVGETLEQREAGQAEAVVRGQLAAGLPETLAGDAITIAYEPVWAIGTGKTATPADAQNAHAAIRKHLANLYGQAVADGVRIQYGGSVKPGNAKELFGQPDIDGGLIGGAALKTEDFVGIITAGQ